MKDSVTPITRDGAINLIRDLKATIEDNLTLLAHILIHERFDASAAHVRAAELEAEIEELIERNNRQAARLFLHDMGLCDPGRRNSRYQRIAVGARNRIRDGHNKLAEILLTTMIEEMEHGKDERTGDCQG